MVLLWGTRRVVLGPNSPGLLPSFLGSSPGPETPRRFVEWFLRRTRRKSNTPSTTPVPTRVPVGDGRRRLFDLCVRKTLSVTGRWMGFRGQGGQSFHSRVTLLLPPPKIYVWSGWFWGVSGTDRDPDVGDSILHVSRPLPLSPLGRGRQRDGARGRDSRLWCVLDSL